MEREDRTDRGQWWASLYDDLLADMLLERADPVEVEATAAFLVEALELRAGDAVFDQCSGIGSLSLPLAERGHRVIAVEQSEGYVARSRREAEARGLSCRFEAADARAFSPGEPCRGAFNWWTSFGYSLDDRDNARMLDRAFEALAPGGVFLLDTMNLPGVLRGFREHVVNRRAGPEGEVVLVRESRFDLAAGALLKRWTYFLPDGRRVAHDTSVRLYMPHELVDLLRRAGFDEVELYGSVRRERLDVDSPRCICRARRPRA